MKALFVWFAENIVELFRKNTSFKDFLIPFGTVNECDHPDKVTIDDVS